MMWYIITIRILYQKGELHMIYDYIQNIYFYKSLGMSKGEQMRDQ